MGGLYEFCCKKSFVRKPRGPRVGFFFAASPTPAPLTAHPKTITNPGGFREQTINSPVNLMYYTFSCVRFQTEHALPVQWRSQVRGDDRSQQLTHRTKKTILQMKYIKYGIDFHTIIYIVIIYK